MKKGFLKLIIVFVLIAVAVLAYLGYVPYLSDIIGTSKPKDLGVRYTNENFLSAREKTGVEWKTLSDSTPLADSIQHSGEKKANFELTNEEMTALANNRQWKYYPAEDVQIKIYPDGTGEMSLKIISSRLNDYMKATGTSPKYQDVVSKFAVVPNPTVYVKGKMSITNNNLEMDVGELQIGSVTVPEDQVEERKGEIESFIEGGIGRTPGLSVNSLTLEDGKMKFDGTLPAVESVVSK